MTTTYFFRPDLEWNKFMSFLKVKYLDVSKVNVINHVCSNGQEPYSLAIKLIQQLGDEAFKFFPILAKDIDAENIKTAKNGIIGIKETELFNINYQTKYSTDLFLDIVDPINREDEIAVSPKPIIKDKVIFEQGDIFKDIETIPTSNTVLLCRNFWPYLKIGDRNTLAEKLYDKLDESCVLVIGEFDCKNGIDFTLRDVGFYPTGIENVYTKVKPPYPSFRLFSCSLYGNN